MNIAAITDATKALLLYAEQKGYRPTTQPIIIEESNSGDYTVAFYGCLSTGDDVQIRIYTYEGGIRERGEIRNWDFLTETMSDWAAFDAFLPMHLLG